MHLKQKNENYASEFLLHVKYLDYSWCVYIYIPINTRIPIVSKIPGNKVQKPLTLQTLEHICKYVLSVVFFFQKLGNSCTLQTGLPNSILVHFCQMLSKRLTTTL